MRRLVLLLVLLCAASCGGSDSSDLAGCWKLSLGGTSGEMRLSKDGDTYNGTFTLGAQTGDAFGVIEPNGNYDVMLSTPNQLLWELSGEQVSEPLTGTATQRGQPTAALAAPRC
jgi:hypothetical protein